MVFPKKYTINGNPTGGASSHGDFSFEVAGYRGGEMVLASCTERTIDGAYVMFSSRGIKVGGEIAVRPKNGNSLPRGRVFVVRSVDSGYQQV